MVELWFVFSLIWSICASVDEAGRKRIDNFLREMDCNFPGKVSQFFHFVFSKKIIGQCLLNVNKTRSRLSPRVGWLHPLILS